MKIKIGTVHKDITAYGNKYWIQIEDNKSCSNDDLQALVDKQVSVVIGEINAIDNLIQDLAEESL